MSILYIDRKGLQLGFRDGVIELRCDGERLRTIPSALLDRVVLRANTSFDSNTLAALAQAGVGIVALGGRGGQRVAHVVGGSANDVRARIAQCQRIGDPDWTTTWARMIVRAKLRSQGRILRLAMGGRADLRKPLGDALATVDRCWQRAADATDVESVRGLEGAGAAAYFAGYRNLFPESLEFAGRRRRPPPDPVNASLSLGYTLATSIAVDATWSAGLDPMVGFLHRPAFGRPSLACDLVEPWRASIDLWVWRMFQTRELRPEHFGRDGGGACLMGKTARARYYAAFSGPQVRLSRGLRRHARLLSRALAAGVQGIEGEPEDWV